METQAGAMGWRNGVGDSWPVVRGRGAAEQEAIDREWLLWIGRFRFVSAELAALRFAVSVQQARQRLRRLIGAGLLVAVREHASQTRAIYLTPKGAAAIGRRPRRKPPRVALQREHELAVVDLAARLELAATDGMEILTERDCRGREAEGVGRFSIGVLDDRDRLSHRWPDLLVYQGSHRMAIEIEFATKSTARTAAILAGYLASDLAEVRFLVGTTALALRLQSQANIQRARLAGLGTPTSTRVTIDAWHGAPEEVRREIAVRLGPDGTA